MQRTDSNGGHRQRARLAALGLAVLGATARGWAEPPPPSKMDDATYVAYLEGADADTVDLRRLSRLMFGIAATLDGGRSSVRLLQNAIVLRDATQESIRGTIGSACAAYEGTVARLGASVGSLLDAPDSPARLERALVDGHETCWRLDAYARMTETYGAREGDLVSILASSEACGRFRRAAFSPGVRGVVERALDSGETSRAEIESLRRELAELEALLEELRRIDKQP